MKSHAKPGVGVIALAASVLALSGCSAPADDEPTSLTLAGQTWQIGSWDKPGMEGLYEGLVHWNNETDTVDPVLAEEYSLSEDRKTLTFRLRQDVDFTDGEHMDAAAVVASLEYDFNRDDSGFAFIIKPTYGVPEMRIVDDYTIELKGDRPFDYDFLIGFGVSIISPASIPDDPEDGEPAAGTGPYVLDELTPETSAVLVRNPGYWNPEAYDFDTITFKAFEDTVAALNALRTGQVDATAIDATAAGEAEAAGLRVSEGNGNFVALALMDREGAVVPALADKRVREAINLAFDRDGIVAALEGGYGTPISQPRYPNDAQFTVEGGDDRYGFDPERARELLAEAGYPDGFEMTLPRPAPGQAWEYPYSYEPIVQQSLADIGIDLIFEDPVDATAYVEELQSGDYGVALWKLYTVNTVKYFPLHGGDYRFGPSVEPELLDLIDTFFLGTADESETAATEIGEYLLDEVWFAPIVQTKVLWASTPEVEVIVGNANGTVQLTGIHLAS
jgi:peptide/nickel transport system substrate-binding protein